MSRSNGAARRGSADVPGAPRPAVVRRGARTVFGTARELAWLGVDLALYPVGLLARTAADRVTERWLAHHRPLPLVADCEARGTPIVMLHGYFHNRSGFFVMRRALRRVGFCHLYDLNLAVLGNDVKTLAGRLAERVEEVRAATGAERVHLVGHSLGGIVARYYVQRLGGAERSHTVVTLGTPHGGTYAAYAGLGRLARQLRPGSPLIRALAATAHTDGVRFVSYYSNLDAFVVPAHHGRLEHPDLEAENVLLPDLGHLSLLVSPDVIRDVVARLAARDAAPALGSQNRSSSVMSSVSASVK